MYVWAIRRRARRAIAHPLLHELVAAGERGRGGRHLPAGLYLAALAGSLLALGRPVVPLPVPADRSAIVLSLDVSGSMRSQDLLPSRLEAAKEAAKSFVRALPPQVQVGLVAFGGYALLLVRPTTDREELLRAIDRLEFLPRTAIGEGLLEAVAALPGRTRPGPDGSLPQRPPGGWPPGVVILLSDGRSNTGIDPLEAAGIARAQEVTVYTVGVGQPFAASDIWTIGGPLDEETLKEIARLTGGTYHHASSARALREVYRRLAPVVGWERRPTEVTGFVALLSAALLVAAVACSARIARLEP
ncbi:MAG: VWA domain-containing protein [Armatimonadota bacterium]|nr:VWA domain-containing protein [Armatimonadota bacterium]MDR7438719.1 VWA domain-containing protein [Armatimonadota bacterium]MDR7561935.1 VWA domain-containing protein [Armatimonadota bacterium]MDR7567508.1 VWA domain-containing protein [Armatimonadota bacterium]MDR7601846.1 VWA domain-containing protein [Armatimonadota bacterium]